MTAGGGVDVLAILDREIRDSIENNQFTSGSKWAAELRAARAAIAALIAADKEYDEAFRDGDAGRASEWEHYSLEELERITLRIDNAIKRRASALAALESQR